MTNKRIPFLAGTLVLVLGLALVGAFSGQVLAQDSTETELEQSLARDAELAPAPAPAEVTALLDPNGGAFPLFMGVDDDTVPAYTMDPTTNISATAFIGAEVWGSAYDPVNNIVYFNAGTILWEWPVGGVINQLGTITNAAGAAQSMVGLAFYDGQLYATKNIANEAIWAIDVNTLVATEHIDYVDGDLDCGGFSADPNDGTFYCTNDDTAPHGAGLVIINPDASVTHVVAYPTGQTDIDGLAVSDDGYAYLVTDEPGNIYVYDLVNNNYIIPLVNPWTTSEVFSAGAYIYEEGGGGGFTVCSAPQLPIPDNNPIGVTDVIEISPAEGGATITDVDLYLNTAHTWVGDLVYTLTHDIPIEGSTTVVPYDRPGVPASTFGCSGNNIDATINDEGVDGNLETTCLVDPAIAGDLVGGDPPSASLMAAFDGESVDGSWSLNVADYAGGDTGTLNEWCLVFNGGEGEDPNIFVDPLSLSSTQPPDTSVDENLNIANTGGGILEWGILEEDTTVAPLPEAPPQAAPQYPPSLGAVPNDAVGAAPLGSAPLASLGSLVRSWNSQNGPYFTIFDLDTPQTLPNVAAFPGDGSFIGAGEFVNGLSYMVDGNNNVYEVDDTGAILDQYLATPAPNGESYAGMALDPTTGDVYASSTNVATSSICEFDVLTGAATSCDPITGVAAFIALSFDGAGNAFGYDIVTDTWMQVNPDTGATSNVVAMPFSANFGQGLMYDPATGLVNILGFNATTFQAELWTVDTSTPAAPVFNFVGVLGSTTPGGLNQLSWGGTGENGPPLPCTFEGGIPWLNVVPAGGSNAGGTNTDVTVTFDSTGLAPGTYTGNLCVFSNDPDEGPGNETSLVIVPVELIVEEQAEPPNIFVDPLSLSSTQPPDTSVDENLNIANTGGGTLEWSILEEDTTVAPLPEAPPKAAPQYPPSLGAVPNDAVGAAPLGSAPLASLGSLVRSWNSQNGPYFTIFDLDTPQTLPNVAAFPGDGSFIGAGEFVNGLSYMVDGNNNVYEVDDTGAILDQYLATPAPNGESYAGMALDPTTGDVYASSTNVATSSICEFDVLTGAATSCDPITGVAAFIALSFDGAGNAFGYDIVTDTWMQVNPDTGATSNVVAMPFSANFGQGLMYDPATGLVNILGFNATTFQAELWTVDTSTPAAPVFNFVGVLGSTTPGGLNQLSWGGTGENGPPLPCTFEGGIPWLNVVPAGGSNAGGTNTDVTVTFDSTGLAPGTYTGNLCVFSNDPDEGPGNETELVIVPVELTVEEGGPEPIVVCSAPQLSIPDNNPTGVTDTIVIQPPLGGTAIGDLNLYLNATHTWVGDLVFSLEHVDTGTTTVPYDRPGVPASTFGCSGNNIDATINDEGADGDVETTCLVDPAIAGDLVGGDPPNASLLASYDGESYLGTWELTVSDNAGGDTGTLNEWCLVIEEGEPGGDPNIFVDPLSMGSTQPPDTQVVQTLTISNTGGADLSWNIIEEDTTAPIAGAPLAGAASLLLPAQADAAAATDDYDASAPVVSNPAPLTDYNWPEAVLWDNGPLVNCPGCGVGGADESVLQTSLGMSTYGFGHQVLNGNWVADDFSVSDASGWDITSLTFFAYQTNSGTGSSMTNVVWEIFDGQPGAGGSVIASGSGLDATGWTNIYRVTEAESGTGTARPIMANTVNVSVFLPQGDYWLNWQTDGTLASGPWAPPITINGQATTGNGLQEIGNSGVWDPAIDTGSGTQQGFPFIVEGEVSGGGGDCQFEGAIPWLEVVPDNGVNAPGTATEVDVTFDSTGLAAGTYTGNLCVFSNDPDPGPGNETELVIVPVELIVEEPQGEPDIFVDPLAIASTQNVNTVTNWPLDIENVGTADLEWDIYEDNSASLPIHNGSYPTSNRVTIGDGPAAFGGSGLTGPAIQTERETPAGLTTITHSASQSIVPGNSVSCNNGIGHTDNSYLRIFDLESFGITGAFDVVEVEIGIESATGPGGMQPATMNLYLWDDADPFTFANLTPIGSAGVTVFDGDSGTVITVPVAGSAPAGSNLVVEFFTPDGQATSTLMWVGSNPSGQTAPTYLAAADCGVPEPTDTAALGFPGMHLVMNVTGDTDAGPVACDAPEDIPWASVAPTGGTTVPGDTDTVNVAFDSTALAAGTYTGVLCVTSNDPDPGPGNFTDLVIVDLELTVEVPTDVSLSGISGDTHTAILPLALSLLMVLLLGFGLLLRRRSASA